MRFSDACEVRNPFVPIFSVAAFAYHSDIDGLLPLVNLFIAEVTA